jgi:hypothetical protein
VLVDVDRGRFAGGADHAEAVGAFGNVPVDQLAQGRVIDAAIVVHGRGQCDDAACKRFHGSVIFLNRSF